MKMKKIAALSLATIMTLGLSATAFAQEQPWTKTAGNDAKITVSNAAKGETYQIIQLFQATVADDVQDGSGIAYKLLDDKLLDNAEFMKVFDKYFEYDSVGGGYITAKKAKDDAGNLTDRDVLDSDAMNSEEFVNWAKTYGISMDAIVSDGSALEFKGLPYGYYLVTSSQSDRLVTVDSTTPDAVVYDKNTTTPVVDPEAKKATNENVTVGDRVEYTVIFKTSNYIGSGKDAEKILKYNIADTLPASYLDDVKIEKLVVDKDGDPATTNDQTPLSYPADFGTTKNFDIAWVDAANNNKSLYENGVSIILTYSALVTDGIEIGQEAENVNKVTITWTTEKGTTQKGESEETIYSYALSIKKVDEKGNLLDGATFQIQDKEGKILSATKLENGNYKVALPNTEGAVTELECKDGYLVLEGVAAGKYTVTEITAPDGYNRLTTTATVIAQRIGSTTSKTKEEIWLDADGNILDKTTATEVATKIEKDVNELDAFALKVVNQKGSELPSTGGIGTTIFYVVGGILVVGAGVVLVAKKRMNHEA